MGVLAVLIFNNMAQFFLIYDLIVPGDLSFLNITFLLSLVLSVYYFAFKSYVERS